MDPLSGLTLAAPAGVNAYIPLLAVALAERLGWLRLTEPYDALGRTWTVQLHRDNGGLALSDVVCSADARHCWAVSALDGSIWKTDDGGEGWRRVWGDWGAGIGGIAFATDEVGYVVGIVYPPEGSDDAATTTSGLLLSTTDGGDTWVEERVGEVGGLDDVCLPGDGRLVVLGDGLVLVRLL